MNSRPTPHDEMAPPLPHSVQAERGVLGSILLNPSEFPPALDRLAPEDFFLPSHARIFAHMMELRRKHVAVDTITLVDALGRQGELEGVGGPGFISQLPDGLPRLSNIQHYIDIIKNDSCRRLAIHRSQAIMQAAFEREDVAEINRRFQETADLIRPSQQWVPTLSAKAFCTMKFSPRTYLLQGLIQDPSMTEIFSWRGVGKTMVALSMSHAVAAGGSFLKWTAPKATPVLYVDGELDVNTLQQRLSFLGAEHNENLKLLCLDLLDDPFPYLATARAQRIIEDKLGDARLLVLDNLSALAPASNEKEGEEWILIQTWLRNLKREGISTQFLHHAGHSGWARGTTRREDLLDVVMELKHPEDYKPSEGLRLEINFTKTRRYLGQLAEPLEASLTTDLDGNGLWSYRDLEDVRLAKVVELKAAGHSWRKIEELSGVPRSTAERLWRNSSG